MEESVYYRKPVKEGPKIEASEDFDTGAIMIKITAPRAHGEPKKCWDARSGSWVKVPEGEIIPLIRLPKERLMLSTLEDVLGEFKKRLLNEEGLK